MVSIYLHGLVLSEERKMKKSTTIPGQTLVMKFGGTSVDSVDALMNVTRIIKDARTRYPRVVVITSAMADVTDLLLESAILAAQGKIATLSCVETMLKEKHFSVVNALIKDRRLCKETKREISYLIKSFVDLCRAIAVLGEPSPRGLGCGGIAWRTDEHPFARWGSGNRGGQGQNY